MNKLKTDFFKKLIGGLFVGIGGILPGVSGGVMAVAFGLYKPMVYAVTNIHKTPKQSIIFLLPIAIGGIIGILVTSQLVEFLMTNVREPVMYLFLGLVASGIPSMVKEGNKNGFKPSYIIAAALGAALMYFLSTIDLPSYADGLTSLAAVASGSIISVGVVIPGMSSSFLLMQLGWYDPLLKAFNDFEIKTLFLAGLGLAVAGLLTLLLIRRMFDKFPGYAFYAVLGFLCVSMIMIFPGFSFTWLQLVDVLLLAGGFLLGRFMEKIMGKVD